MMWKIELAYFVITGAVALFTLIAISENNMPKDGIFKEMNDTEAFFVMTLFYPMFALYYIFSFIRFLTKNFITAIGKVSSFLEEQGEMRKIFK